MTRTTDDDLLLRPAPRVAWRLVPASAAFELRVDHPLGPARISATFGRVEGVLRRDRSGRTCIDFAVDTASLEPGPGTDPRLRAHRFVPDRDAGPIVLFESTRVVDEGHGRLSVSGELAAGAERLPVELRVDVIRSGRTLRLTAVAAADHRRLGATWLPPGALRAPAQLVLRADLRPVSNDRRARSIAARPGSAASRTASGAGSRVTRWTKEVV